ncbi:hypothetical protein ACGFRG_19760 [Streptomyces sp. NPDC048696]|uniref:hypothetical protein n=1 Tax=Streptomyces sp. NPDC048696 TaxID=3365585 RepID=UPI00371FB2D4
MRRCVTVAAIALCGAFAAGTTGPAAAASHPGPADGQALSQDRRDGDDDPRIDPAMWPAELNKLIADRKKEFEADVKEAKDDFKAGFNDSKANVAEFRKEIADLIKELNRPTTP